jgi:HPt (histidine-containing phosphotransfer) domain-containing protein
MYYITNQNNQIIAIDPNLLALLNVENIDELYRKTALGDIKFSSLAEEEEKITIAADQKEETYDAVYTDLSGILGDITLVQVQISSEKSLSIDNDIAPIEELLAIGTAEEDIISILDDTLDEVSDDKTEPIEESLAIGTAEEDIISILDDTLVEVHTPDTETNAIESNDELFDLIVPTAPEETIDEISLLEKKQAEAIDDSHAPIVIDIKNISQSIGISTEEYNTFLNEYIDTALSLEKDLQGTQEEKRSHAIGILSHLSHVLHLPAISEIVTQIETATADNQKKYIEFFYATLARLTTTQLGTHKEEETPLSVPETETETETETIATTTEGFGTINLNDVQSIHFDFQLESAANDLNLPVELIKEFVHDFIEQAHTETKKMLEAYEKGDLDTIQQIGHLLKGASSNLRIEPLSDTLYEIQFCEDSSKLEKLIKDYWAHFLSLETQINLISTRG